MASSSSLDVVLIVIARPFLSSVGETSPWLVIEMTTSEGGVAFHVTRATSVPGPCFRTKKWHLTSYTVSLPLKTNYSFIS
jgi:hypothetical protein